MKRANLDKFHEVPQTLKLDRECQELNVSFLQVLAILSFEKHNHDSLKKYVLDKLEGAGMFDVIFEHFDKIIKEEKNAVYNNDRPSISLNSNKIVLNQATANSDAASAMGNSVVQSGHVQNQGSRRNLKTDLNR